jgi:adenosylcobinamide kinase/adenosylcobinamide-phosphate guanylyltransferase
LTGGDGHGLLVRGFSRLEKVFAMMRLVRDGGPRPLAAPGVLPRPGRPRRGRAFRVLVLGGARSGKSVTAERMLAGRARADYVACGRPADDTDPSWAERVRLHRERRPAHWTTLETLDLEGVLAGPDRAGAGRPDAGGADAGRADAGRADVPVLVDCLSTWLAGVMDECGLWTGAAGADKELAARADGLLGAWRATRRTVVAVSNEVGLGVVPATPSGARYRDELGRLNARVAAECEQVWLCTAGIARRLR